MPILQELQRNFPKDVQGKQTGSHHVVQRLRSKRSRTMPLEDDQSYIMYMRELDCLQAAIRVYKNGIIDEMDELNIIELIRSQLAEAIEFASSGAHIVSLNEFSKLKKEMEELSSQVRQKRAAIQNIEAIMKDRSSQVDLISKKIDDLKKKFENANVLEFKK